MNARHEDCRLSVQIALANVGAAQTKLKRIRKAPPSVASRLDEAESALRRALVELAKDPS